jgi:hypothetical protein
VEAGAAPPLALPVRSCGLSRGKGMGSWLTGEPLTRKKGESDMNSIFYVIGVVVVVFFVLGYFGLR